METKVQIQFENRCENLRYRLDNRELLAYCTHGQGSRLFSNLVTEWEQSGLPLKDAERIRVIKELIEWMSRPGFVRRVFGLGRKPIILVVDADDKLRSLLEDIPAQMASEKIKVNVEYDSLQKRKDYYDKMIVSSLKTKGSYVIIRGKQITTPEEFLAIEDRYDWFTNLK